MRTALVIGLAAAGAVAYIGMWVSLCKAIDMVTEFEAGDLGDLGDDDDEPDYDEWWSQAWADDCQRHYDDETTAQLLDVAVSRDGRIMMSLELIAATDEAAE